MAITNEEFAGILLADQLCSSLDEAIVVAECVLNDAGDDSENLLKARVKFQMKLPWTKTTKKTCLFLMESVSYAIDISSLQNII